MSTHHRAPAPARVSLWGRLVRRYGWRAYALPVLAVLTIVTLVQSVDHRDTRRANAASSTGHRSGTTVEGLTGNKAKYQAAATPAPIVVDLGSDISSCGQNTYAKLLLVSISQQHMWACQGAQQVNSTAVTTGSMVNNDQTPLGSWRVQGKQTNRYLVGPGYRDYVQYWVPFNGDFGLHDASWQTMPFGSPDWKTLGSHGCVHVPTPTMAWVYQWAEVGNTVVTVEA